MEILYCKNCKKPYGLDSRTVEEAFTSEGNKLRRKFRKMKHCICPNEKGWEA